MDTCGTCHADCQRTNICGRCNHAICTTCMDITCSHCEADICDSCWTQHSHDMARCTECENNLCTTCVGPMNRCGECTQVICPRCIGDTQTCGICKDTLCNACTGVGCHNCGIDICSRCWASYSDMETCAICTDRQFCSDCATFHVGHCGACNNLTCSDCADGFRYVMFVFIHNRLFIDSNMSILQSARRRHDCCYMLWNRMRHMQ